MGKPGRPTMLKVTESVQDRVQDRDRYYDLDHDIPDRWATAGAGGGR